MKRYLIITATVLFYFISVQTNADIITAASCSQNDVQAAIYSAKDGDIVLVPEGSAVWISPIDGIPAVEIKDKSITLRGAGIDKTFICDSTDGIWAEWGFRIIESEGKTFRITGFTFSGKTNSVQACDYFIVMMENSKAWRIDHCKFTDWTEGAILHTRAATFGVLDHCLFDYAFPDQPIQLAADNAESWTRPLTLGTANAVYIENCNFNNTGEEAEPFIDGNDGARVVARYNKFHNSAYHNHGRDSGSKDYTRSMLSYEIYNNIFTSDATARWCAMSSRGGTGVIFNNVISGNYNSFFLLYNYCSCWEYDGSCPCWPQCIQYPCTDQIGRAPDTNGDSIQELEPLYEWGNTVDISGNADPHFQVPDICPEMYDHLQEGRDYYNNTPRPAYTPYTFPHPLTVPGLVSPQNNSSDVTLNTTLTWNRLLGALQYRVQVAKDSTFTTLVIDTNNLSDTSFTLSNLDSGTCYFWQVDEVQTDTMSSWSPAWNFFTVGAIGIKKINESSQFKICEFKAHINPRQKNVKFIVDIPKLCDFTLEIYTIKGQRIWTYKKANIKGGTYHITWNGMSSESTALAKGVYIARMSAGDVVNRITILLY